MSQTYSSYKDSGIECIGRIPSKWRPGKLKHVVDPSRPITYGIVQAGPHHEGGVPYIRPADVSDEQGVTDEAALYLTAPDIAESYRRSTVSTGDLVCSIGPSFGKAMVVPETLDGANLTQGTARVAVADRYVARFIFWVLRSTGSVQQWESAIGGATFRALNLEPLANTRIPLPSLEEQRAIAAFLDRETGKIDALVEEQRRLIALLKEKRQAVISHAVTKGLDPTTPLKPSGIDWLGDIPEHWEVRKISSVIMKITNGYVGPTRDMLRENGVRYLQSLHIKANKISFDMPYYVDKEWSEQHAKSILKTGDVLIVQTGDIGQVAVVPSEFEGCNCHALIIVSPLRTSISGEWMSWVLCSDYGFHSLLSIQTGALHPHLNCGNVKFVWLPIPPLDEQEQIMAAISGEFTKLDALISEAETAIDLLQERRSALISAAVTGKIDVRDTVATDTAAA